MTIEDTPCGEQILCYYDPLFPFPTSLCPFPHLVTSANIFHGLMSRNLDHERKLDLQQAKVHCFRTKNITFNGEKIRKAIFVMAHSRRRTERLKMGIALTVYLQERQLILLCPADSLVS